MLVQHNNAGSGSERWCRQLDGTTSAHCRPLSDWREHDHMRHSGNLHVHSDTHILSGSRKRDRRPGQEWIDNRNSSRNDPSSSHSADDSSTLSWRHDPAQELDRTCHHTPELVGISWSDDHCYSGCVDTDGDDTPIDVPIRTMSLKLVRRDTSSDVSCGRGVVDGEMWDERAHSTTSRRIAPVIGTLGRSSYVYSDGVDVVQR